MIMTIDPKRLCFIYGYKPYKHIAAIRTFSNCSNVFRRIQMLLMDIFAKQCETTLPRDLETHIAK